MGYLTKLAIAVLAVLMASCQAPTARELSDAYIGDPPSNSTAHDSIRRTLSEVLKDYDSARIDFGFVYRGWIRKNGLSRPVIGWVYPVEVNAKNSFGAYTGWKTWRFLFLKDILVAWHDGPSDPKLTTVWMNYPMIEWAQEKLAEERAAQLAEYEAAQKAYESTLVGPRPPKTADS